MNSLKLCIESALAGGNSIFNYKPKKAKTKKDVHVGHHAIVTSADYKSQKAILSVLKSDKEALFITEEHVKDKYFIGRLIKNIDQLRSSKVYIIDELDGSSSFNIGHYEWSISVGLVENLQHKAGAVYAPKINNGLLFYASKDNGAFIRENGKETKLKIPNRKLHDSYILFGPDCFLTKYPRHNSLMHELSDLCRTSNVNGSCALALSLVASGKADALIQPLQCPWDYAAGKLLVEEAGGKVIFYEMNNGKIKVLENLEPKHYDPFKRAVGFIAGNRNIAEDIAERLIK
ncbi:MAG: inositol monophosphatase [Nanoarchaeota archaeon]|nr:inositol monophosphatase [Nanoarchaeota archaeon]